MPYSHSTALVFARAPPPVTVTPSPSPPLSRHAPIQHQHDQRPTPHAYLEDKMDRPAGGAGGQLLQCSTPRVPPQGGRVLPSASEDKSGEYVVFTRLGAVPGVLRFMNDGFAGKSTAAGGNAATRGTLLLQHTVYERYALRAYG